VKVTCLPVQPRRKRVPQRVNREWAGDSRLSQPPREVELNLPRTEATAGLGADYGHVRATGALCGAFTQVLAQQPAQLRIEEHALPSPAAPFDTIDIDSFRDLLD
jgi:hypothetical protein